MGNTRWVSGLGLCMLSLGCTAYIDDGQPREAMHDEAELYTPEVDGEVFAALAAGNCDGGSYTVPAEAPAPDAQNKQIVMLYCGILNRFPDDGGMIHYSKLLVSGWTLERVADGMANSVEFGNISDPWQIVARFYHRGLRRAPDPGGHADWVSYLGSANRGMTAVGIIFSPEGTNGFNSRNTVRYSPKATCGAGCQPFRCPLASCSVSSPYGMRFHPIRHEYRLHAGADLRGGSGTHIYAANDGTVIQRGYAGGAGNRITIDHGGGVTTRYLHMSHFDVPLGARVKKGQLIGRVGSTGMSTGPHLHFEYRIWGSPKNPMSYIR